MDFVRAIKKTPIVVNDCRGFYANRCVGNYIREGHLHADGGRAAGDDRELPRKWPACRSGRCRSTTKSASISAGKSCRRPRRTSAPTPSIPRRRKLLEAMVVAEKRFGRKNGKGFYDYPEKGPKSLWPGLAKIAGKALDPDTLSVQELKDRFLVTQSLEAARCMEEKVVTDPREADVGSILGFGFAPFAGGTLSYIDGMGVDAFRRARAIARRQTRRPLHAQSRC